MDPVNGRPWEAGDICPDCEIIKLPGALCPFHANAGNVLPTLEARLEGLEKENKRLREALEEAFLALGRAGGNSVPAGPRPDPYSQDLRESWLSARAALKEGGKE